MQWKWESRERQGTFLFLMSDNEDKAEKCRHGDNSLWEQNMLLETSFVWVSSPWSWFSAVDSPRCRFSPAGSWERAMFPSAAWPMTSGTQPAGVSWRCWDRREQPGEGFEGRGAFDCRLLTSPQKGNMGNIFMFIYFWRGDSTQEPGRSETIGISTVVLLLCRNKRTTCAILAPDPGLKRSWGGQKISTEILGMQKAVFH